MFRTLMLIALVATAALPACAGRHAVVDAPSSHMPPFDANVLRANLVRGTGWAFEHTDPELGVWHETTEIIDDSDVLVTMRETRTALDGTELEPPLEYEATWSELVSHATYSRGDTVRTDVTVDLALGSFDGVQYVTTGADGHTTEAIFVREFPGPPVVWVERAGDTELHRMELVARWEPMDAP